MYKFPFEVPEDFASLNAEKLAELKAKVVAHAKELSASDDATAEAVDATFELIEKVETREGELAAKAERDAKLNKFVADAEATPEPTPDPDEGDGGAGDADPAPEGGDADGGDADGTVTASEGTAAPKLNKLSNAKDPANVAPENNGASDLVKMFAAANQPRVNAGAPFEDFSAVASAVEDRIANYGNIKFAAAKKVKPSVKQRSYNANIRVANSDRPGTFRTLKMGQYSRDGVVRFERNFSEDERIREGDKAYDKLLQVANEKRLPGGSLRASTELAMKAGKGLTAAAGWCAASEVLYGLCELESMDGILDLPELQASRGGFQIPEDGGPDFASIFNAIGDAGDTHLSEYDVENDTLKVCTDIPCPDFIDTRLGVDYVCLTGSLLQRRGYPEMIARFSRGAMVALAHKINAAVIADIVTAAGAATVIPADTGGDDAAAAVLSGVDLAIVDMKYRNRMPFSTTLEVILPMWVLQPIRAALARRNGIGMLDVTDAMILDWFTIRDAVPRFVYDWQDALTGEATGPGGATALTTLPATVNAVIYPAGTFTKAVQDVVQLDTIYDSTGLSTNEYTALFAEDGWAVLQTCPDVRHYTFSVDPSGCVGCISAGTS